MTDSSIQKDLEPDTRPRVGTTTLSSSATAAMDLFNSSAFDTHVSNLINQWHVPGLAIALVHNEMTTSKGFGLATLDPPIKCTADTLFDIASASKSLTAASVGLLVDDESYENVQWDSKMSDLLSEDFVMAEESYTKDVTVEDILSHRSGLPGHDNSYMSIRSKNPDTPKSVTRNLRNLQVAAPIRTKYMYCNMMLTVATHMVEALTGQTFEDFLHGRFFQPLGMSSTNLQPDAAVKAGLKDRMSTPYAWDQENNTFVPLNYEQSPEDQGAGSIITSANDYIKWVREIMNHEGRVIGQDLYDGITRPRIIENPDASDEDLDPFHSWTAYAVGWETYFYRGHRIVNHDGLIGGFGTSHFFIPELKFGGVIFGNSGETSGSVASILMKELIDEALGIPREQRVDWNALQAERDAKDEDEREEEHKNLREEMCSSGDEPHPQKVPLNSYTGEYFNLGYHSLAVTTKDQKLFVDATDRSMGYTLSFEHICDQTKYIAHLADWSDPTDTDELRAEFRFENDEAVKMGLHLEPELDLIWFEKVASAP